MCVPQGMAPTTLMPDARNAVAIADVSCCHMQCTPLQSCRPAPHDKRHARIEERALCLRQVSGSDALS